MPPKPKEPPPTSAEASQSSTSRAIISVLLFIHLFCLLVALSGNYYLSPLQIRLTNALAPYIQFFKIKPTAPYHLTDASELSDDHFIEVEVTKGPQQGNVVRIPDGGSPALAPYRRAQFLARTMGATSYLGAEPNTAAFAKAVGTRVINQGENEEVEIRVRRYQPQQRELDLTNPTTPADPTAEAYVNTPYEARVWRDQYGQVQLLKIEEREVVAPLE